MPDHTYSESYYTRWALPWLALIASLLASACGNSAEGVDTSGCPASGCPAGTICNEELGCLPIAAGLSPALEVIPPVQNNQGWVPQEFAEQSVGPDGVLRIQLAAGASLEGRVYSSDWQPVGAAGEGQQPDQIPARIVAWRDSLLPGRPKVQVETTTPAGTENGKDSYVLWLGKGYTYTLYVSPKEPFDQIYPPLLQSEVAVDDHLKLDFVLDGENRSVVVSGRVLDSAGAPLPFPVRVRAFKESGLRHSTFGESSPQTGEFSFRVPASQSAYSYYTVRVETKPGSTAIPTMDCPDRALGLVPDQQQSQPLGDLQLPAFLFPKKYSLKVQATNGTPVSGATVTFSAQSLSPLTAGGGQCSSSYSQTAISDSEGKVELWLMPGSNKNQVYSVTVISPPRSPYASQWIEQLEVGAGSDEPTSPRVLEAIVLDARYRVSGQVLSSAGHPITGASIGAQGIATLSSPLPASKASATSAEDGSFELHVDPGFYNLEIHPPQGSGLPSFGLKNFSVQQHLERLLLTAPSSEVLLGQVLDPSGQPLTDTQVNVFDLVLESKEPLAYGAVKRGSAITDLAGGFSLYLPLTSGSDQP